MSKYNPLWEYITQKRESEILLSFEEVKSVLGFEIDHSFLNFKKELLNYQYRVEKISLKEKTVRFVKNDEQ